MRGRFIAHAILSVLATSCIATTFVPAAAEPRAYRLTLGKDSRLFLPATVNGTPVVALLDSAAETTLVDRAFAARLKLGAGTAVTGQGSGQSTFEAAVVEGVALGAVGLELKNQTIAVVDLSDVGARLVGHPLEVILGREIFDAARLRIDVERGTIEVLDAASVPGGVRLELKSEHGVETLPVRVEDGETVPATFDLGNGSNVLLGSAFATRAHLLTDGRPVTTETGGGLGGAASRQTLTLRALEVAGQRFTDVRAAVDPQPSASDLNIGVSILRRFVIVTDFGQHLLWLEPRR